MSESASGGSCAAEMVQIAHDRGDGRGVAGDEVAPRV